MQKHIQSKDGTLSLSVVIQSFSAVIVLDLDNSIRNARGKSKITLMEKKTQNSMVVFVYLGTDTHSLQVEIDRCCLIVFVYLGTDTHSLQVEIDRCCLMTEFGYRQWLLKREVVSFPNGSSFEEKCVGYR